MGPFYPRHGRRVVWYAHARMATPFRPMGKLCLAFASHLHASTHVIASHSLLCLLLPVVTMAAEKCMDSSCVAAVALLFPLILVSFVRLVRPLGKL
jgi:hypothetical protein